MNIVTALFLGLLLGWLAEWLIDWFYWRRRLAAQAAALETANAAATQAQAEAATAREQAALLEARALAAEALVTPASHEPPTIARRPDDLTKIKGIGPVIAKKLYAAGIMTYQQLARLSTTEFEAIIGDLVNRFVDEDGILEQAQALTEKKQP